MMKYLTNILLCVPFMLQACPDCGGTCTDCDEDKNAFIEFIDTEKIQKQTDDNLFSYLHWRKAKIAYTNSDYEKAVHLMNKALDNETHCDNAFFILERAKMKQMAGEINSSLEDLNNVINQRECQQLYDSYYVKALYGAISILAQTNRKLAVEIYEKIRKHDNDIPKIEVIKNENQNTLVYSNLSSIYEDNIVRKLIVKNFIQFGLAKSEDDIDFSDHNTIVVNFPICSRKNDIKDANPILNRDIEFCKQNCTSLATAAFLACGYLPTSKCRIACTATVEGLRRACDWCCDSGDFYSKCIKPLEKFFPPPCDPAWD